MQRRTRQWLLARAKRQQNLIHSFLWMLDKRNWRRHPAPFNKTRRGLERRSERLFIRQIQHTVEQ